MALTLGMATAGLAYSFRVDAASFAPRTSVDVCMEEAAASPTVADLEARLEALPGPENAGKRRRLRDRLKKLRGRSDPFAEAKAALHTAELPASAPPSGAPRQSRPQRPRSRSPQRGFEPNIAWRAIDMAELRAHPSFIALPPAHRVVPTSAVDLRLFRQDSRQWWACHAGRISTSACASCLGVYEDRSASLLGVPPSLRGHGKALDAHSRLQSAVLDDYGLLQPDAWLNEEEAAAEAAAASAAQGVWRPHPSPAAAQASPFLYEYRPRKGTSSRTSGGGGGGGGGGGAGAGAGAGAGRLFRSVGQIRMAWGSVQEATSILAALNYLGAHNATVEEAGLQPLEALCEEEQGRLPKGLPPIGASPDGIVR
jgi:hypothetical protein